MSEECSHRGLVDILDFTLLDLNATTSDLDSFAEVALIAEPAAVCVFAQHVHHIRTRLTSTGSDIFIVAVAGGFPVGDNTVQSLSSAIGEAITAGADEIDFVLEPRFADDFPGLHEEALLRAAKEASRGKTLKVILETSLLSEDAMVAAAEMALECGADFLKTSTGKRGGATTQSARVLTAAIRRHEERTGSKKGIKLSGGIRTPEDAHELLQVVIDTHPTITTGEVVLNRKDRDRIRIGASSLMRVLMPTLYDTPPADVVVSTQY